MGAGLSGRGAPAHGEKVSGVHSHGFQLGLFNKVVVVRHKSCEGLKVCRAHGFKSRDDKLDCSYF